MKKLIIVIIISLSASFLFTQSNDILDDIIGQKKIDFDYGVYAIFVAGGLISDDTDPVVAVQKLSELNWKLKNITNSGKITLGQTSLLLMNALNINGGIMFSLLKNERYAYKELVYKGILNQDDNLNRNVSGVEFLIILGDTLEYLEGKNE